MPLSERAEKFWSHRYPIRCVQGLRATGCFAHLHCTMFGAVQVKTFEVWKQKSLTMHWVALIIFST